MWECPHCGESVPDGFDACWKCRYGKDGSPPIEPAPVERDDSPSERDLESSVRSLCGVFDLLAALSVLLAIAEVMVLFGLSVSNRNGMFFLLGVLAAALSGWIWYATFRMVSVSGQVLLGIREDVRRLVAEREEAPRV